MADILSLQIGIKQAGRDAREQQYLMRVVLSSGWDDNQNGGKLCLYHNPGRKDNKDSGEQVTLVAPAGDTLVIFDSRMEHEVMPSFADR